ncbi:hypothetical protein QGM71_01105 [Virgibacillus sp. C22-A2]|uniref:DUF1642 domain-containing protein n=1 Tax=Virgibacillus tibetensis TaxID=3042313 RepID=A0ABU6KA63_9BACI|nr:hypothetical protein [Virgibacillus sp. C22-A2]
MNKVKVTQDQADAIHQWRTCSDRNDSELVETHIRGWVLESDLSLNELDLDDFIKALYIGYEVEPQFKVGDWVVRENVITKITNINYKLDSEGAITTERFLSWVTDNHLRHATPEEIAEEKERRWWSKHGRENWELKNGDVLDKRNFAYTVRAVDESYVMFNEFATKKTWDELKKDFKVACFAEKRLDKGESK